MNEFTLPIKFTTPIRQRIDGILNTHGGTVSARAEKHRILCGFDAQSIMQTKA